MKLEMLAEVDLTQRVYFRAAERCGRQDVPKHRYSPFTAAGLARGIGRTAKSTEADMSGRRWCAILVAGLATGMLTLGSPPIPTAEAQFFFRWREDRPPAAKTPRRTKPRAVNAAATVGGSTTDQAAA